MWKPALRDAFLKLFDHPRRPSTGMVLQPLDGLRGLAILMVIFFHSFQWINPTFGALGKLPLVRNGWSGVELFVILSGYLIYGTLAKYDQHGWWQILLYFKRRFLRIYPVYVATVMVGFLVAMDSALIPFQWYQSQLAVANHADVMNVFSQLFLLRGIDWSVDAILNPPAWSLGVEVSFYLIVPLYVFLSKPQRILSCLVVLLLSFLFRGTSSREWGIFYFFFAGISIYELMPHIKKLSERNTWLLFGVGLLSLFYFWGMSLVDIQGKHLFHRSYNTGFLALGYCGLVIAAMRLSVVKRLLAWYPLRFVGIVSYSLFLWHFFILASIAKIGLPNFGLIESLLVMLLLVLPATLTVAMLSYSYIERPFIQHAV